MRHSFLATSGRAAAADADVCEEGAHVWCSTTATPEANARQRGPKGHSRVGGRTTTPSNDSVTLVCIPGFLPESWIQGAAECKLPKGACQAS
jgi:hypothetical protein